MSTERFPHPTLSRRNGALVVEEVALASIVERFGTPAYVYSKRAIVEAYQSYTRALAAIPHQICYALKANSNLGVIDILAREGAGFDIVSQGELMRVIAAGADPSKVIFSGVAKTAKEMDFALKQGIGCFNVESEPELERLQMVAKSIGRRAPITFRVNPDVDAKTHPYISTGLKGNKFGVAYNDAHRLYLRAAAMPNIEIIGIECHIGSQLMELSPYEEALVKLLELTDLLEKQGVHFEHIDLGGGLGINYANDDTVGLPAFAAMISKHLAGRKQTLFLEPGRSIVGNSGVLLTNVEYVKTGEAKNFCIVDAGMNDLLRPSLYAAHHEIVNVVEHPHISDAVFDIVGPVCESTCFLGKERVLRVQEGDTLAVLSAGAYGFVMASNYNTRVKPCEVMIDDKRATVIREREQIESLFSNEHRIRD